MKSDSPLLGFAIIAAFIGLAWLIGLPDFIAVASLIGTAIAALFSLGGSDGARRTEERLRDRAKEELKQEAAWRAISDG